MKLTTYNILNGGKDRLSLIRESVNKISPDFLTINEANTFTDNKVLKEFAEKVSLPNYEIALSGEYNYHVACFSKYPFIKVEKITPLMRAGILTVIDTYLGEISIIGAHLTPYTEKQRLPEIDLIAQKQKPYKNKILMGDMNSLSSKDGYSNEMVKTFNDMQIKKFTKDGKLSFGAVNKILSYGYIDSALQMNKNKEYTAPTTINEFSAHSNMRLDYIFISSSLLPHLSGYSVIKDKNTDKASDHYPVVIELN